MCSHRVMQRNSGNWTDNCSQRMKCGFFTLLECLCMSSLFVRSDMEGLCSMQNLHYCSRLCLQHPWSSCEAEPTWHHITENIETTLRSRRVFGTAAMVPGWLDGAVGRRDGFSRAAAEPAGALQLGQDLPSGTDAKLWPLVTFGGSAPLSCSLEPINFMNPICSSCSSLYNPHLFQMSRVCPWGSKHTSLLKFKQKLLPTEAKLSTNIWNEMKRILLSPLPGVR